ncbi:MAG TPA: SelD-related putative sulfur metabolism protein [Nitrososphaeraceae archaeon]|jgi:selenophosphate synthase
MSENFWDQVDNYRKEGIDPLRWIPTCSNEPDNELLKHVLGKVKRCNVKIDTDWFDAFHYSEKKSPELTRRVFTFDGALENEVMIHHALSLLQVHNEIGEEPLLLENTVINFFKKFKSKVLLRKNTVSLTSHKESQFALLDYIQLHKGDKVGFSVATNSATQIFDPMLNLDSEINSNIAMVRTIDHLNLLGCTSGYMLYPIYDASTENMLDKIRENLDKFTSRYNLGMEDYSSLKIGKPFFGNTALANTLKELPVNYQQVEAGMQLIISNKLGMLSAFALFMLLQIDPSLYDRLNKTDIKISDLFTARDQTLKSLGEPKFSLGRVISKYCPDFGTNFDKSEHIMAVYPVSSEGILAVKTLSMLTNSEIMVNEVPMLNDEIAKFVTSENLISNSTIPANGCHLIIASSNVSNLIIDDLQKHNYEPFIIGYIANKERPSVKYNTNVDTFMMPNFKLQNQVL